MTSPLVDLVVPTIGRPSLVALLGALAAGHPRLGQLILVDDRPCPPGPLLGEATWRDGWSGTDPVVVVADGRGPAAARNVGWRRSTSPWVCFVDDDVEPAEGWLDDLVADLESAAPEVAVVQGRVTVPSPAGRRPTDWERNVAGLEGARWITADLAIRRAALILTGGFDERFGRAYREDVDLALRIADGGWRLERGRRAVCHPVRPAGRWVSVSLQANNGADALMTAAHGRRWRRRVDARRGRRHRHLLITASGAGAIACRVRGRRTSAAILASLWAIGTGELAWARIAPGPRTGDEILTMVVTSLLIPPVAVYHWLAGLVRLPLELRKPRHCPGTGYPGAVLFDRDGTLVHDVPYNGDPERVVLEAGATAALDRLRANGVPVGILTNQSGVARGLLTTEQVDAVNQRVAELAGPFDVVEVCPHDPEVSCRCRKPGPGMVEAALRALDVPPSRCVVVGDIGSDVAAAEAAGARGILVPNLDTRREEITEAREVVASLAAAVDLVLGGGR